MTDIRCSPHVAYVTPAARHLYQGKWMTALELSQLTGIPRPTIYARLRRGAPIDVVGKPGREPKRYLFRGERMTVPQVASMLSMDKSTIYDRISGDRILEGEDLKNPHVSLEDMGKQVRIITYRGKSNSIIGWARETGIKVETIHSRMNLGWPFARIITEPVRVRADRRQMRRMIARITRHRNRQLIHRMVTASRSTA
ncbi:hypothetical protein GFL54_18995 [Rhizobium laguerreae]|uniref:hypothetical protein n=1 Tax=Rhizobium laguerreae TaxID=1076926 RepID=UPI00143F8741|nr:hypothetical protein [Rhizobium laguerreae]NKM86350.1 hypothetical protein [Rhizobium laguerreae]